MQKNRLKKFIRSFDLFSVVLWAEESALEYCYNGALHRNVVDQEQCQTICLANTGCVGISYTHNVAYDDFCYICNDDLLQIAGNGFGFYRRDEGVKTFVN